MKTLSKIFLIIAVGTSLNTAGQNQNTVLADTSKGFSILVNKTHFLPKSYIPSNLVMMKEKYGNSTRKVNKTAYEAFVKMCDAAKSENINLWITSAYRTYQYQNGLYEASKKKNGSDYANHTVAKAGFSEHQTGLAIDIVSAKGKPLTQEFEQTKQFKWLSEHAHEYGFILRYPKGKKDITGYNYEPWHYRYVGVETAKKIKKSNLVFEEYYKSVFN